MVISSVAILGVCHDDHHDDDDNGDDDDDDDDHDDHDDDDHDEDLLPVDITGAGMESPQSFASKGDLYQYPSRT